MSILAIPPNPSTRRFGFENELSSGASDVISRLHEKGLAATSRLHYYHCDCDECEVEDVEWLFHGQEDSTVDGEIITSILTYGSGKAEAAFKALAEVHREVRPTVESNAGFHVHVEKDDLDDAALCRLWRIFYRYQDDLEILAAGKLSYVRGYNQKHSAPSNLRKTIWEAETFSEARHSAEGSWLYYKYNTVEFRLWNATRVEWRMRMYVAISVALVEAAKNGEDVTADDERSFDDFIAPYLSADGWRGIERQRAWYASVQGK